MNTPITYLTISIFCLILFWGYLMERFVGRGKDKDDNRVKESMMSNELLRELSSLLPRILNVLVESLSDRLQDSDVADILDYIDHNEWAVGYNILFDRIYDSMPISQLEYELICMLDERSDHHDLTTLKKLKSQVVPKP